MVDVGGSALVRFIDKDKRTMLHVAASAGLAELVNKLLDVLDLDSPRYVMMQVLVK
jgi:hypothetical protein